MVAEYKGPTSSNKTYTEPVHSISYRLNIQQKDMSWASSLHLV